MLLNADRHDQYGQLSHWSSKSFNATLTLPFIPVACQSIPVDSPRSRNTKSVLPFVEIIHKDLRSILKDTALCIYRNPRNVINWRHLLQNWLHPQALSLAQLAEPDQSIQYTLMGQHADKHGATNALLSVLLLFSHPQEFNRSWLVTGGRQQGILLHWFT